MDLTTDLAFLSWLMLFLMSFMFIPVILCLRFIFDKQLSKLMKTKVDASTRTDNPVGEVNNDRIQWNFPFIDDALKVICSTDKEIPSTNAGRLSCFW
ncbi:hypothetical protein GJ496_008106 [Pomphorhynchus laevis]|nr:hypothetical protein GJ496_008106 [Pomphorhynchus laevis]